MNRTITAAVAALAIPPLALSLGVGLLTSGAGAACPITAASPATATAAYGPSVSAATMSSPDPAATRAPASAWDDEQLANARIIATVGNSLGVPPQGRIIALAVALQESSLRNLRYGDRDSLGLFQQRPSQGWGTRDQILTPTYAATRFYQALVVIPDWQQLPLTEAADAVQRSAHPLAYANQEAEARQIYDMVTGAGASAAVGGVDQLLGNPGCLLGGGDGLPADVALGLPAGFALPVDTPPPVRTAIAWALGQLGTPYSYGGDCTDAHSGNPAHQCDCSSLVQQAYAHAGTALPRTTGDQVRSGTPVTRLADIKPGDLIFIPGADGTAARPGHVGLYIGGGRLVHAPHTGTVVQLAKITAWSGQVAALRRIQF